MSDVDAIKAARDRLILEAHGPGLVQMSECRLCGYLEWRCTDGGAPSAVSISPCDMYNCPRCQEARQRNPELVNWVVGVASTLTLKILELEKKLS